VQQLYLLVHFHLVAAVVVEHFQLVAQQSLFVL
jgi:hypothetical protein